jgi:hypothetical protein
LASPRNSEVWRVEANEAVHGALVADSIPSITSMSTVGSDDLNGVTDHGSALPVKDAEVASKPSRATATAVRAMDEIPDRRRY